MEAQERVRIEYPNGIVFEPDAIELGLTQEAKDIMQSFDDNLFYIEDHMSSPEEYESFLWVLMHTMEYGFEHKEFRTHPVQFKFYHDDDEVVKWLQFRHFISNAILWIPMVYISAVYPKARLTDEYIIDETQMHAMTVERICDWLDDHYTDVSSQYVDGRMYSRAISATEYFMSQEAVIFLPFMGLSITLELFIDLANRMPRYKELLYFKLDTSKQPTELEEDMRKAEEEHRALILNDEQFNPMKALIHAIKGGQLREIHTIIGCKADDNGNTIAEPINVNYLTGSLSNIVYYYINCIGGRKASVYNKEYMGKTGYLLNLVVMMASSVRLSKTVTDCQSANPIPYTIRSKKHLAKLHGRYYRYATEKEYHEINGKKDVHLIGETVYVRDPVTCAARDGVCPICYGQLYYTNKKLNSPGALSGVIVMNPVTQKIMGVKHFQETHSTHITFPDNFNRFFELNGDEVTITTDIEGIEDYMLVIRKEDLRSVDPDEDMDMLFQNRSSKRRRKKESVQQDGDDSLESYRFESGNEESLDEILNLTYATNQFEVMRINGKKTKKDQPEEDRYIFYDESRSDMVIHADFVARLKTKEDEYGPYYYIPLEDISTEEFIFMVDIENEEASKASKQIQNLIGTMSHEGCDTIESVCQRFLDLLIEAKHPATAVHASMVLYKLIRSKTNILKRPDFRRVVLKGDYDILSLTVALKHDPSITISLASPFLKYQFISSDTTFEKTGTSDLDYQFMSTLTGVI